MKKILLLILLTKSFVCYAEANIPSTIFMFKKRSCGDWMQAKNDPATLYQYQSWFRGFFSGYNFGENKYTINNIPDDETIVLYIDKRCRDNPLQSIDISIIDLTREIRQKIK